ncbi:MAG: redox-regulated ATPase YchF [Candidatus Thermoplasmatota archaeon]|nr:redox-regulated ATPase YchF [Candidatus Thermoplasmatota archaeon]
MDIRIVGKPNVGKSTFFSAATLAHAEIASYPFTTIAANKGVGYVRAPCPHLDFKVQCNPNNSLCEEGTRLVPVELIDVAGLVPGAHSGKGLGNKFLDDLRHASALIHIVDASGGTDAEGNPVGEGEYDPVQDVHFLEEEVTYWIHSILSNGWEKAARTAETTGGKIESAIHERLTGLGITEAQVFRAMHNLKMPEKPRTWTERDLFSIAKEVLSHSKPILIAANKADRASDENVRRLTSITGIQVIPCCADYELALRRASKAGVVDYIPGSEDFKINEGVGLNKAQEQALETIRGFMKKNGGTGVQKCLETAVYDMLHLIPVYPVEDDTHLTNKDGMVLPDVHLLPEGSNALDLAAKVHTDLAKGFIRAIDTRTKRVVGHDHPLKAGDVIRIVAKA